ncbi:MAG: HlyD family type I secretion periplasmic adaptor subunit [Pseudomonadota bacterium]
MFGRSVEQEFINSTASMAGRTRSDRSASRLLLIIALGLAGFFYWASTSDLEMVTRGTGRVIPTSRVQIVQSLEGGIVQTINVREGDLVDRGQVLMQIDDTGVAAQQGELEEREGALLAEQARLQAEAAFQSQVTFPEGLVEIIPLATAAELELFLSRRAQLESELAILNDQLVQRRSEFTEQQASQEKRNKVITPLREEIALTETLTASGAVPRIQYLRLQSQLAELEGDLLIGEATLERLQSTIAQAENEIAAARSSYALNARQRLARLQVELAVVQETLRAASDRVQRTQLRAPVRGTINALPITTIGAVVRPGQAVAEIVPADDGLLIEADIRPQDVAFLAPGAPASVKISAYDYLTYGDLPGKVERIGADTIANADGVELFRVVVRTERNYLGSDDDPLPISPGMIASIDIGTGNRTVLDYIIRPIQRARYEALRER